MHTVQFSVHFSSIWGTQVHCSCWIVWYYYYFGTEDLKTDQNNHCEQNLKRQRPAEVTKVCTEEASACGQVGWGKGCVHPLTAIDGDSTGTILIQGQGTLHRQTKLHCRPGWVAMAGQREERALSRSVRHSPCGFIETGQLKAPRKGGLGCWAADPTGVSSVSWQPGGQTTPWGQTQGWQPGKEPILLLPSAQKAPHLQLWGQLPQRPAPKQK